MHLISVNVCAKNVIYLYISLSGWWLPRTRSLWRRWNMSFDVEGFPCVNQAFVLRTYFYWQWMICRRVSLWFLNCLCCPFRKKSQCNVKNINWMFITMVN